MRSAGGEAAGKAGRKGLAGQGVRRGGGRRRRKRDGTGRRRGAAGLLASLYPRHHRTPGIAVHRVSPYPGHCRTPAIAVPQPSPYPGYRRTPDIAVPRASPYPRYRRTPGIAVPQPSSYPGCRHTRASPARLPAPFPLPHHAEMPQRKAVPALSSLCLESLARHMEPLWAKDYSQRYLDEYRFRFVIGPFDGLAGSLVQELLRRLGESRRLTRAALHLLLVPHLRELSLRHCRAIAGNDIGRLLAVRCKVLRSLDLHGCGRLSAPVLAAVASALPGLQRLGLGETRADAAVLEAVGRGCRRLRELDVSGCAKASLPALRLLAYDPRQRRCGSPALRVLLARGLEPADGPDAEAALAFVLLALPRLEVLAHGALPAALRRLHEGRLDGAGDADGFPPLPELARLRGAVPGGPPLALPLRLVEDVEAAALAAVGAVCPHAEELSARLGEGAARELRRWQRLQRLALGGAGALAEALPAVRGLGVRLRTLALHGFRLHDERSLLAVLAACPGLRAFTAELHAPTPAEPDADAPPRCHTDLLPHGLPRLHAFSLALSGAAEALPARHVLALSGTLGSVLCAAPRLQSLRLLAVPFPLDALFETVLAAPGPPLRELRELSLAGSRVSGRAVWLLLASDGPLRRIDLSRCRDVSRRDYDAFVRTARRRRLDLDIAWQ